MRNNLAQRAATTPPPAAQGDGGQVTSEPRTLSEEMEGGGKGEGEREVGGGEGGGKYGGGDGDVGVGLHDVGDGGLLEEEDADDDAPSPPKKKAAVGQPGDAPPIKPLNLGGASGCSNGKSQPAKSQPASETALALNQLSLTLAQEGEAQRKHEREMARDLCKQM